MSQILPPLTNPRIHFSSTQHCDDPNAFHERTDPFIAPDQFAQRLAVVDGKAIRSSVVFFFHDSKSILYKMLNWI